ncbi:MAG: response regulator [Candidatus Neomarinimicrobiota bacterium]
MYKVDQPYTGSATILLIEDDREQSKYLRFLLNKLNLNVVVCSTGEEALSSVQLYRVDACLCDINLQGNMSGFYVLDELRWSKHFSGKPVIAITDFNNQDQRYSLFGKGFSDFIKKPVDLQNLATVLDRHLPV